MTEATLEIRKLTEFAPDSQNANKGTPRGLALLEDSISEDGAGRSMLATADGVIIAGNKTQAALIERGIEEVIVVHTDGTRAVIVQRDDVKAGTPHAQRMGVRDNRTSEVGLEWSVPVLDSLDIDLGDLWFDSELAEMGLEVEGMEKPQPRKTLAERFIVPPFTVLDARQGYWQERKRAWIALGLRGELGRGGGGGTPPHPPTVTQNPDGTLNYGGTAGQAKRFDRQRQSDNGLLGFSQQARSHFSAKVFGTEGNVSEQTGTSIFDPVLCEVAYRWFCPPGGHVLDPFAGEATKGIVAGYLGFDYTGIELRQEQVDANIPQAQEIGVNPTWVCGDSAKIDTLLPDGALYDLVFTSPPYYDLEVYSADKDDGSAMGTYVEFMEWYSKIFAQAVARLRDNRFLVVKVGEIRDKKGIYRNFVGDNISCFLDLGLSYYNEAILVTPLGSLPIRVGRQFSGGRKLGKTHQNILVFYKGDPKRIKGEFPGGIEYADLTEAEGD